jgi:hypothetical protein
VASTVSARTLTFQSVTTTSGASESVVLATGVIDFPRHDATEEDVERGPGAPPQWNEVVVFAGSAYERPATDRAGVPRFVGVWTSQSSFAVAPFAPLSGPTQDSPPLGGSSLRRVAATSVGGVSAIEYQLSPVGITCVLGDGDQRSESVSSTIWVDASGRILKFENLAVVAEAGVQSVVLTVTTFDRFGAAVAVDPPLRVGAGPPSRPVGNPLAGCLLTPG